MNDLTISVASKLELEPSVETKTEKYLYTLLNGYNYSGTWRLLPLQKCKANKQEFSAKRIEYSNDGGLGIKIVVRPVNDEDFSWNYILVPPRKYDIHKVLNTLQGKQVESKPEPEIPSSSKLLSHITPGETFVGIIKEIYSKLLLVELQEGIVGGVSLLEYSHQPPSNFQTVQKLEVGKAIDVMVLDISGDSKINLSHRYADRNAKIAIKESQSFVDTPGVDGTMSLAGFAKDYENAVWLVQMLAKNYIDIYKGGYISRSAVINTIQKEVKARFNVEKVVNDFQQIISLLRLELIERYGKDSKTGKHLGYRITDKGWREVGGRDQFLADDVEDAENPNWHRRNTTSVSKPAEVIEPTASEVSINETRETSMLTNEPVVAKPSSYANDIAEFIRKMQQYNSLKSELRDVLPKVKEFKDLEQWLTDHNHLADEVVMLEKIFKK